MSVTLNPAPIGMGMPANLSRGNASALAIATYGNPEESWFRNFVYSSLRETINHEMVRNKFDILLGNTIVYQCFRYIGKSPLGACFHHSELIDDPSQLPSIVFVFRIDQTGEVDSTGVRQAKFRDFTFKAEADHPIACEFSVEKSVDELPRKLHKVINESLVYGGDSPQGALLSIINGLANPDLYPCYPNWKMIFHECHNFLKEFREFTNLTQKALVRDECQTSFRYIMINSCNIYNIANAYLPAKTVKYHDQIRFRLTNVHKLLIGGINKKFTKDELTNGFIRHIVKTYLKVTDNTILPFPDCLSTFKNCPFTHPDGIFLISQEAYEYLMMLNIVKTVNGVMTKPITMIRFSDEDFHPMNTFAPQQFARKREVNMYGATTWERNEDGAFRKYETDTPMTVAYIQSGDKYILVAPLTEEQFERKFLDHESLTGISTFDSFLPCGVNPYHKSDHNISPTTHYNDQHDYIHTVRMRSFKPWFKEIYDNLKVYCDTESFQPSSYPFHRPTLVNELTQVGKDDPYSKIKNNECVMYKYLIQSYGYDRHLLMANIKNLYNKQWHVSTYSIETKLDDLITLLTEERYNHEFTTEDGEKLNEIDYTKSFSIPNYKTKEKIETTIKEKKFIDKENKFFRELQSRYRDLFITPINKYQLDPVKPRNEIDKVNSNEFNEEYIKDLITKTFKQFNDLPLHLQANPNAEHLQLPDVEEEAGEDQEAAQQRRQQRQQELQRRQQLQQEPYNKLLALISHLETEGSTLKHVNGSITFTTFKNKWVTRWDDKTKIQLLHIIANTPNVTTLDHMYDLCTTLDQAVQYQRNIENIEYLKNPQNPQVNLLQFVIHEVVHEITLAFINEMNIKDCYDPVMGVIDQCVIRALLLTYEDFAENDDIWDVCSPGFGLYYTRTNFMVTDHAVLCRPSGYGNLCSKPVIHRKNKYDSAYEEVKYRSQFNHCMYSNSLNVPSILIPNFYMRELITTGGPEVVSPHNIDEYNTKMERVLEHMSLSNQIDNRDRHSYWYPVICPVDMCAKMFESPNSLTGRYGGHYPSEDEFKQYFSDISEKNNCDIIYKDVYTLNPIYNDMKHNINQLMYEGHMNPGNPLFKYHTYNAVASASNQIMTLHHRRAQQANNPAMMINEEINNQLKNEVMLCNRLISDSTGVAFNQTCWSGEYAPTQEENNRTKANRVQPRPDYVKGGLYFPGFNSPVTTYSSTETHRLFHQGLIG